MPYVELFNANAGMQSRRPEKNAKSPKSMEQIEAKGIQLYIKRNLTVNIRLLLFKKMHRRLWRSNVLWAEHFQHTAIIHRGVLVGCSVCSSMEFVFPNLTIYPASIAFFRVRIDISRTKQFTQNAFRCPCSWSWAADFSMSVTGPLNSGGADMSSVSDITSVCTSWAWYHWCSLCFSIVSNAVYDSFRNHGRNLVSALLSVVYCSLIWIICLVAAKAMMTCCEFSAGFLRKVTTCFITPIARSIANAAYNGRGRIYCMYL